LRVVYFGMIGAFSIAPLAALLDAGIEVGAVITPTRSGAAQAPIARVKPNLDRSPLPIVNPYLERNIVHLAWEHGIPVFEVSRLNHSETLSTLTELQPDVGCVACFSRRIPAALLELPRLGFLNVHPALLPAYRGPEPLFWTFRNGETATGVTIHFMDEGLDTGDIALQAPLELPAGISGAEAGRLSSKLGGQLLVEAVRALERGTLARHKQSAGGAYSPTPAPEDFILNPTWPARRAFNFMRGTAEWGRPYRIEVNGERLVLKSAISFSTTEVLSAPVIRSSGEVWIQFNPGVLRTELSTDF